MKIGEYKKILSYEKDSKDYCIYCSCSFNARFLSENRQFVKGG